MKMVYPSQKKYSVFRIKDVTFQGHAIAFPSLNGRELPPAAIPSKNVRFFW
jgi:hypothetical protein